MQSGTAEPMTENTSAIMAELEKKRKELADLEQKAKVSPVSAPEAAVVPEPVTPQAKATAKAEATEAIKEAVATTEKSEAQPTVSEEQAEDAAEAAGLTAPKTAQKPAQEAFEAQHGEATDPKAAEPTKSSNAPYGVKKDGTPRSKPGPKGGKGGKQATKVQAAPKGKTDGAPYGFKKDGTPRNKPGPKGSKKAAPVKSASKPGPKSKAGKPDNWAQNGGSIKLAIEELNSTEKAVLLGLSGLTSALAEPKTISDLAQMAFPDESDPTKANSKTRNGLRRLVKAGLAKKTARGKYLPSKKTISQVATQIMEATAA